MGSFILGNGGNILRVLKSFLVVRPFSIYPINWNYGVGLLATLKIGVVGSKTYPRFGVFHVGRAGIAGGP